MEEQIRRLHSEINYYDITYVKKIWKNNDFWKSTQER